MLLNIFFVLFKRVAIQSFFTRAYTCIYLLRKFIGENAITTNILPDDTYDVDDDYDDEEEDDGTDV